MGRVSPRERGLILRRRYFNQVWYQGRVLHIPPGCFVRSRADQAHKHPVYGSYHVGVCFYCWARAISAGRCLMCGARAKYLPPEGSVVPRLAVPIDPWFSPVPKKDRPARGRSDRINLKVTVQVLGYNRSVYTNSYEGDGIYWVNIARRRVLVLPGMGSTSRVVHDTEERAIA